MRGELVDLEVEIVNTNGGMADIPLFRLLGAAPLFAIEAQENSYPAVEFARYRLRAVQAGQAALRLSVNFATADGCSGSSDRLPVGELAAAGRHGARRVRQPLAHPDADARAATS